MRRAVVAPQTIPYSPERPIKAYILHTTLSSERKPSSMRRVPISTCCCMGTVHTHTGHRSISEQPHRRHPRVGRRCARQGQRYSSESKATEQRRGRQRGEDASGPIIPGILKVKGNYKKCFQDRGRPRHGKILGGQDQICTVQMTTRSSHSPKLEVAWHLRAPRS